jgi:hypothetical protein
MASQGGFFVSDHGPPLCRCAVHSGSAIQPPVQIRETVANLSPDFNEWQRIAPGRTPNNKRSGGYSKASRRFFWSNDRVRRYANFLMVHFARSFLMKLNGRIFSVSL